MILPGATLGMLGGGQLGGMFTVAARTMGYRVIVLDPDQDSPAGRIANEHLHVAYTDEWALSQLAQACDVVTTEFENVPAATLRYLEQYCPVRPSSRALELTQDRIREKTFIRDTGLSTSPFAVIKSLQDIEEAFASLTPPLILKRSAMGYDGKGQRQVETLQQAQAAFHDLGDVPCVLEQKVNLEREVSVILGRSTQGESTCFPVAENEHVNGILNMSIVPARVTDDIADKARSMAIKLADALEYCGVMAVEFFITKDQRLLVNEIAPRPHNSGHYTLDACMTSQFEQQVRMICELPAGETTQHTPVVMGNLMGDLWGNDEPHWQKLLEHSNVKLHLYGKNQARVGRKMGHCCCLDSNLDQAQECARRILLEINGRQ